MVDCYSETPRLPFISQPALSGNQLTGLRSDHQCAALGETGPHEQTENCPPHTSISQRSAVMQEARHKTCACRMQFTSVLFSCDGFETCFLSKKQRTHQSSVRNQLHVGESVLVVGINPTSGDNSPVTKPLLFLISIAHHPSVGSLTSIWLKVLQLQKEKISAKATKATFPILPCCPLGAGI